MACLLWSKDIDLFDDPIFLVHVDGTLGEFGARKLRQQVEEDVVVVEADAPPADAAVQIDPRIAVLVDGPQADHFSPVEPAGLNHIVYRPHLRVDPAFAVRDAEKAVIAPARPPAVLANPIAARVVVADARDAMAAGHAAA